MFHYGIIIDGFGSKWYGVAMVNDLTGKKRVFVHWTALRRFFVDQNGKFSWKLIMDETVPIPKIGDKIILEMGRNNDGYYATYWSPISFYDDACGHFTKKGV